MRGEAGGVGRAVSRAFGTAFGAKGVWKWNGLARGALGELWGCHGGSAEGFCNDWSVPSVRISCVLWKCSRLELCHFGVASLTSVELLCCDVWLYFYFSKLFLQGQCCVSQRRGWHLQNQSRCLTAVQLFKGTARCHGKMCCSTLHPGWSNLGFYLPCCDLYI